jgi:lipopolysaccharide transport system ATP-binding protein
MADNIIRVENLGKKYIIGHQRQEKYTALRDVISQSMKNVFQKSKELLSGKMVTEGDVEEEFWALQGINFEIKPGDRVGIIGRNGAGKSTLLKVLSRITEPSTGRVVINGRVASLLEVGTGFHPELTGRENIFLNGAILGMGRAEIRSKFDEIVAFAEVEKFLDTPVKRYSSGMYVRLAFAVAAHLEPEILIVDEVLAVGDAQFQKKCLGKMEDVSKNEGRTVLFVSHNMGVVSQLCSSAMLLKKGMLVKTGSVNEIVQEYLSNLSTNESVYTADELTILNKKNFISRFSTLNSKNLACSEYGFDENIYLNVVFCIRESNPNLQIGIVLLDKMQNRVFTLVRDVIHFSPKGSSEFEGTVKLPSALIAPNIYSFAVTLWSRDGNIDHLVENICMIKIHDTGTELANYEGNDYGSVILKHDWL